MTATKFNFDAIESCRTAMNGQAGQFGGLSDGFQAGGSTSADVFGKLDASAGIAGAVDGLNGTVHGELNAAEELLRKVERALDSIETNIHQTEEANAKGLTPA
ncbi:hypothetical protein BC739_006858 [Kutzneria viridogrisea]|uniref:Excreted virulence factor EspC (Type VII ESX diderm) n=1 Tax=Kutzneria viridogrisea TaxID=47990 RepID=A0ABR6BSH8_9PSEU|nr:hypothetical protein [Kutzneria albida]MBA8929640.1 hypothetical protein [Kutzneria viridogrisea]